MNGKVKSKAPVPKGQISNNNKRATPKNRSVDRLYAPSAGRGNAATVLKGSPKPPPKRKAIGTGLSDCAAEYARALVNPWSVAFDTLPCVPSIPAQPTQRFRIVQRGNFFTSATTGAGFVCWCPFNPTSDTNSIWSSIGSYTGTSFAITGTGVVAAAKTNLPYGDAEFATPGAFLQSRPVGSGMRVRYIGETQHCNGTITGARGSSEHDLTLLSAGQVINNPSNVYSANDFDWKYLSYIPQDSEDLDMTVGAIDWSSDGRAKPTMGFFVTALSGTSGNIQFEWELVEFWEFVGETASQSLPGLVKSHSDPVGLARVLEGVQATPLSLDSRELAYEAATSIINSMAHSDSAAKTVEDIMGIAGMAIPAIGSLIKNLSAFIGL